MGEPKNTIEINGKLYDARTGKLLNGRTKSKQPAGAVMDGVVKRPHKTAYTQAKPNQSSTKHHKRTEKSETLLRKSVKKPSLKPADQPKGSSSLLSDQAIKERIKRAHTVDKSSKIRRFARNPNFTKTTAPLAVKQPDLAKVKPASTPKHPDETTIQHFEQAVQDASSHLNKYTAKKKRKLLRSKKINALAGSLAVVLLVGFFAWQNEPNIRIRLASADAGFSAHLPGYNPAGFGLSGPIQSQPGKVTINFKSRTDDRSFQITQAASNWSSESLSTELASKSNKQTWQEQGKTVYTYDDSSAAWVDSGVWYQIEGNADLTSDQLRRIVNSF